MKTQCPNCTASDKVTTENNGQKIKCWRSGEWYTIAEGKGIFPSHQEQTNQNNHIDKNEITVNNTNEPSKSDNNKATAALIFGIISLAWPSTAIGPISAVIAITLGFIARQKIRSKNAIGRKKAAWGIGLGVASFVFLALLVVLEYKTHSAIYELLESKPELFQNHPAM